MTVGVPVVRRITPEDWPALRALRLEALRDTPIGFLEAAADAQALDDDAWRARARRGAVGDARAGGSLQVMALDGSAPLGTVVGTVREEVGWLLAVYVTPRARGQGLLGRLVAQVAQWLREGGPRSLHLEVHEDNGRARRAYERLGFVPTGVRRPYPPDPRREQVEMALALDGAHPGSSLGPATGRARVESRAGAARAALPAAPARPEHPHQSPHES